MGVSKTHTDGWEDDNDWLIRGRFYLVLTFYSTVLGSGVWCRQENSGQRVVDPSYETKPKKESKGGRPSVVVGLAPTNNSSADGDSFRLF
jgi:hypothetical protein